MLDEPVVGVAGVVGGHGVGHSSRPGCGFGGLGPQQVVDGAVDGVATGWRALGSKLRLTQPGFVRSYALGVGFGAVLLLAFIVTRMNL